MKLLKKPLFLVFLWMYTLTLSAQVQKKSLLVSPFTVGGMVDEQVAAHVSQYAFNAIVKSQRVEVVNGAGEGGEGLRASESSSDYVMQGSILGVEIKEKSRTNEETGEVTLTYEAYISFVAKITDPKTGQIIASEQMRIGNDVLAGGGVGSLLSSPKTPEAAMGKAMKALGNKVKKFIQKNFKLEAELVEITEKKGLIAKSVLISGGTAAGFRKNQKLAVSIRNPKKLPSGKVLMRTQQIGEIKISKVEDENFSIAQVLKGGKEIANAIEGGMPMSCVMMK